VTTTITHKTTRHKFYTISTTSVPQLTFRYTVIFHFTVHLLPLVQKQVTMTKAQHTYTNFAWLANLKFKLLAT